MRQAYEDPARIFPTHLPGGVVAAHAERGRTENRKPKITMPACAQTRRKRALAASGCRIGGVTLALCVLCTITGLCSMLTPPPPPAGVVAEPATASGQGLAAFGAAALRGFAGPKTPAQQRVLDNL